MIITKDEILKKVNGESLKLSLLIKDYSSAVTKTGSPYFNGIAESKGTIPFKVWSGELYDRMAQVSYKGVVVDCTAEVNYYGNQISLILKDIKESEVSALELQETPYDSEALWLKLNGVLQKNMSEKAYEIFQKIITPYEDLFKVEVAASKMHDNFVGGLLAHSYKMVVVLNYALKMYKPIAETLDSDLLYLAVALHDVGKVREYSNGALSEISFAGHHITGVEIISAQRDLIIGVFGEEWYYRLLSVITQHHGEFGEMPRTVEALLVHNIDMFESQMQLLSQNFPLGDYTQVGKFRIK